MVEWRARLLLVATLMLVAARALGAKDLPDYRIGDVAQQDIVSPVQLVVIDPEETAALKQREAARVPVICRYNTNVAEEVESEFRSAFANARSNFLDQVEAAFKRRTVGAPTVSTPRFQRLVAAFQRQNRSFPLNTNLAAIWAQAEPDSEFQAPLVTILREAMAHPIRPADLPPDLKLGMSVRLVQVADWTEALTLEMAQARAVNFPRTNLIGLVRARNALLEGVPPEGRATAKFLGSLLKTNFAPDLELTLQARAKRIETLWAADRYEAGQVIIKEGQVIDRKARAALEQLREKTAIASLQAKLQAKLQEERSKEQQAAVHIRWAVAGLGTMLAILLAIIWRLTRVKRAGSLLPARVPQGPMVASETPDTGVGAEMRARLAPHLAQMMMNKLVGRLLAQRAELIETQKKTAAEMAELEARLEKIHAPLQERLRAYEQRIGELEEELAQKGQENRELIKLKIQIVRNQLKAAKDQLEFN